MYDKELVIEIFKNIAWSLEQIAKRFQTIQSSNDFLKDDIGLEKLDSNLLDATRGKSYGS